MRYAKLLIGITLAFVLALFTSSALRAQEAVIVVEAWSPQALHDLGLTSRPSNGLPVVGREELVYLFGKEASGEEVTAFAWSIASAPTGSVATLDSTDTQRTTFIPDSTGQYQISLSITTASGSADTSVTITSALYVGVGTIGGLTPDIGAGQCAGCHPTAAAGWDPTQHNTALEEQLIGMGSSHFAEECLQCHTTGYDTLAANGGFADVAEALGWTFPDSLHPDVWDDLVGNFPSLAHLANVQCESCHGPGSEHRGDASKTAVTIDEGVCAKCHAEEPFNLEAIQWVKSGHANPNTDRSNIGSCARCHSGYGFIDFIDTEVDKGHSVTLGFNQVSCAVCHDPHKVNDQTNPMQLRNVANVTLGNGEVVTDGGRGRFCGSCHISRRNAETYVEDFHDHFGPHHSNQLDMLAGKNAITFGKDIPSGSHITAVTDLCIGCHMAATPPEGQPGHNSMGEHTFAMHSEEDGVDNVDACLPCHTFTSFNDFMADFDFDEDGTIETAREEIMGTMDNIGMFLPPFGEPEVVVDTTEFPLETYTPIILRAAYNYAFVEDDGSYGMHNFDFAMGLLQATLDTLRNVTSVETRPDELAGVPKVFALYQNYPNPFNPTTTISFDVPKAAHVRLVIFNALGREVEILVDKELAPNSYTVEFNAASLSSGLYFYKITSDNFVVTKKMLLLK